MFSFSVHPPLPNGIACRTVRTAGIVDQTPYGRKRGGDTDRKRFRAKIETVTNLGKNDLISNCRSFIKGQNKIKCKSEFNAIKRYVIY